ncbi:hypothetical protein HOE425_331875 [Hoeflea sp. EC-HK425]|nr:hypothetical protein HOE425_331875 [Hoeflea sp. EC-HK425]
MWLRQGSYGGLGKEVALHEVDAEIMQHVKLGLRFNTFTHHFDTEIMQHAHVVAKHGGLDRRSVDIPDQTHVELDHVGLKPGEKIEARIAGTEIIDGRLEAQIAVGVKNVEQMRRVDALGFGKFEHDPFDRKSRPHRGFQGQLDAGLGFIDRVRQEIDGEVGIMLSEIERGRELDRRHPAFLVEGIAVGIGDLGQDNTRPLAFRAAQERLVGEHALVPDIQNRLESHGDVSREFGSVSAPFARLPVSHCGLSLAWSGDHKQKPLRESVRRFGNRDMNTPTRWRKIIGPAKSGEIWSE